MILAMLVGWAVGEYPLPDVQWGSPIPTSV